MAFRASNRFAFKCQVTLLNSKTYTAIIASCHADNLCFHETFPLLVATFEPDRSDQKIVVRRFVNRKALASI